MVLTLDDKQVDVVCYDVSVTCSMTSTGLSEEYSTKIYPNCGLQHTVVLYVSLQSE